MILPTSATHLSIDDIRRVRVTLATLAHKATCNRMPLTERALTLAVSTIAIALAAFDTEQPVPAVPPLELELGEVVG